MSNIQNQNFKKTLPLARGDFIVLIDMIGHTKSATWEDSNRNIYRINTVGDVVWRIATIAASDETFPYTNIYFDQAGDLKAYCWDGGEYNVNIETGDIDQGKLLK